MDSTPKVDGVTWGNPGMKWGGGWNVNGSSHADGTPHVPDQTVTLQKENAAGMNGVTQGVQWRNGQAKREKQKGK